MGVDLFFTTFRSLEIMKKSFSGDRSFLSNMHLSDMKVNGLNFCCLESAYQSFKTLDPSIRKLFETMNGYESKKYWKDKKDLIRPDWNNINVIVMRSLLLIKFRDPYLKSLLLATNNQYLVEENFWHDNYWGKCVCTKCLNKEFSNHLGVQLMEVRDHYRQEG